MALESFNNQNIAAEVQKELNNLKNADDIDLTGVDVLTDHKTLMDTFAINKTNYPGVNMEAVKNVFQNMCGKNFDQIGMKDLYKLNSMQKSQLAREVVATKVSEDIVISDVSIGGELLRFSEIAGFFQSNYTLTQKGLKDYIDDLCDPTNGKNDNSKRRLGERLRKYYNSNLLILNTILNKKHEQIDQASFEEYKKMFKIGDIIPLMPDVYSLATGDLSGTNGIGGKRNVGREYFYYDLTAKNQTKNVLTFGTGKGPAQIAISAYGMDQAGGNLSISLGTGGNIERNYTNNGLELKTDNLPNGVTRNNGILEIPNKSPYSDNPIEITTKSKFGSGNFDEVMFNFTCVNAGIARKGAEVEGETNYGLGKFEPQNKDKIAGSIEKVVEKAPKSIARNIPVDIGISIDNTKFTDPSEFLKNTEDFGNDILEKYKSDTQLTAKIQEAFSNFQSQINVSNFTGEAEQNAQIRLAECRFWVAIDIALSNEKFKSYVKSGKFKLNPQFQLGSRKITVNVDLDSRSGIKQ